MKTHPSNLNCFCCVGVKTSTATTRPKNEFRPEHSERRSRKKHVLQPSSLSLVFGLLLTTELIMSRQGLYRTMWTSSNGRTSFVRALSAPKTITTSSLLPLSPLNIVGNKRCHRQQQLFRQPRSAKVSSLGHFYDNRFESMLSRIQSRHLSRQYCSSSSLWMSSTARSTDEDLESVLDDLLGSYSDSQGEVSKTKRSPRQYTTPKKDVGLASVHVPPGTDYRDKSFLSTSNPFWVHEGGLSQGVIDILSAKGISHFTPVQGEAFTPIVNGQDVIGRSRTGTGKTLAYSIPSLTRMLKLTVESGVRNESTGRMAKGRPPTMLVLCPTRELARQVQEECSSIAKPLGLTVDVVHGGVSQVPQLQSLQRGIDVLVGTPGRVIDHLQQQSLSLSSCAIVVLDEADEMLKMGFAEDVETILEGIGSRNNTKTQFLLFSATTPAWVKNIGRKYQSRDVVMIDSTSEEGGARVANTVRHLAIQLPPGEESKKAVLEDIIAVEIAKSLEQASVLDDGVDMEEAMRDNPVAAAAIAAKRQKSSLAKMQQKLFGKTIVFTETKKLADDLVSGSVFKCLTAQAIHGDVSQSQRESTLAAFRSGSFNVLVATDVAARGIDIQDVDLVIQFNPPRDVDTYVHRSGRTGRAGKHGVSVLLFSSDQSRDIVRIERDLGHDFKFDLMGPPSVTTALEAVAKTSAIATKSISPSVSTHFVRAAKQLLEDDANNEDGADPVLVVARCLAAMSRRTMDTPQSRSLLTGALGLSTIRMTNQGRELNPSFVMFTITKLSSLSQQKDTDLAFQASIAKIQPDNSKPNAILFDMNSQDAQKLVAFSKDVDAGGSSFEIVHELAIERSRAFGTAYTSPVRSGSSGRRGGYGDRYKSEDRYSPSWNRNSNSRPYDSGKRRVYSGIDQSHMGRSNRDDGQRERRPDRRGSGYERNDRNDSRRSQSFSPPPRRSSGEGRNNDGW